MMNWVHPPGSPVAYGGFPAGERWFTSTHEKLHNSPAPCSLLPGRVLFQASST
ncbi:hypothetical protein [Scytonema sp. HK-05]|uniref:hypothetical protein n=1 Tax=Scytonema sp. HK-05 TaxID=1137095 RepID=UPI001300EA41|nr:hypothetical protein [Scytonema sp. HK-05]